MKLFQWIANFFASIFSVFSGKTKTTKPNPAPKPVTPPPTPEPPVVDPPPLDPIEEEPVPEPAVALPNLNKIDIDKIGKNYNVSNGTLTVEFTGFKKGFYTYGDQKLLAYIDQHADRLEALNLSESALNMMQSVSDNEGNLDAINTWDNSFLSIGLFQWSMGASSNRGELAALLNKIKQIEPALFQHYFGQFEIDIAPGTSQVYGFLTFKGRKVDTITEKNDFRTAGMGYRFWMACQHPAIQAIQVEHALSRLKTFYWKANKVKGKALAEVITSEYGVSLILDNHVNRPGYVMPCVRRAWDQAGLGGDPKSWTTEDEGKLIAAYLKIRETYGKSPMTDAAARARNTKKYLNQGIISDARHSFSYNPTMKSRGLESIEEMNIPTGYQDNDYEEIIPYDEENN